MCIRDSSLPLSLSPSPPPLPLHPLSLSPSPPGVSPREALFLGGERELRREGRESLGLRPGSCRVAWENESSRVEERESRREDGVGEEGVRDCRRERGTLERVLGRFEGEGQ
eukprot:1910741-Rhodomonas_salina.2